MSGKFTFCRIFLAAIRVLIRIHQLPRTGILRAHPPEKALQFY
jgi:hypothetical protein